MDLTPRQLEFQGKLGALLSEYAAVVGPAFDGADYADEAEMPVATRWLLVTDWSDVAAYDNGPWVILNDSGINWVERMGLIHVARHMIENCD